MGESAQTMLPLPVGHAWPAGDLVVIYDHDDDQDWERPPDPGAPPDRARGHHAATSGRWRWWPRTARAVVPTLVIEAVKVLAARILGGAR